MKIEKAIEIKENHQRLHPDEYYQELLDADNLSIEALDHIQRQRKANPGVAYTILKGETDE